MRDEQSPRLPAPNDRVFKASFTLVDVARDFFRAHLSARLGVELGWEGLKLEPGSFIDEQLATRFSDLLYSVPVRGQTMLLYLLFEHQSTVDPDMPLRLLVYMGRIWEQWRKQAAFGAKAPCIVPLVLHQGPEGWNVSQRFADWLAIPEGLEGELLPFQPSFEHVLVDLSKVSMEEIRGRVLVRVVLSLMKAVRADQLEEWLEKTTPQWAELLMEPEPARLLRTLLRYAFEADATAPSTLRAVLGKVKDERAKRSIMSIAEQLREEGRQEGRQEGQQEGLLTGRIQLCQELLRLPLSSSEELAGKTVVELKDLLRDLEARLRQRYP